MKVRSVPSLYSEFSLIMPNLSILMGANEI